MTATGFAAWFRYAILSAMAGTCEWARDTWIVGDDEMGCIAAMYVMQREKWERDRAAFATAAAVELS